MPTLTVRIDRATRADLPAVVKLIDALAAHHDDVAQTDEATLARDVLGDAPWVTVLVARDAARIVGYAALCPLAQLQFGIRGMDMHHLFVSHDARAQGVGRALVKACVQEAEALGCRYLAVGTHPDNQRAQKFYETLGFSRRPDGPRFRLTVGVA